VWETVGIEIQEAKQSWNFATVCSAYWRSALAQIKNGSVASDTLMPPA
jgi:hypothetical protein